MSTLALALIEENKRTREPFLDLGNCSLATIPGEIFEHHWLETLSLSNEWWDWNPKFTRRVRCATSNVGDLNSIGAIPAQIANLKKLKKLWLNGDAHLKHRLADLRPLSSLSKLKVLGLASTSVRDLNVIAKLSTLQAIDLWGVEDLENISPLSKILGLRILDICGTRVKNIKPLSDLRKLQFVNINDTPVTTLLPLLSLMERGIEVCDGVAEQWVSSGIFIEDCAIVNPPPEIIEGGTESIVIFLNESKAQGVDHLYEAKMLILGEGGAGKTSLLRRLYQPNAPLPSEEETTKGIDIFRHRFKMSGGQIFRLNVWDFGGQEIYHATHQFFLTKRSLYILLDDTRRDNKTVHDDGFKYWLEVIDALSGHSPVVIFQNEKGGRRKVIDEAGIRGRFTNVTELLAGDLITATAVDKLRKTIELQVQNLPHVGETLPAKWLLIRADLEKESKQYPYISDQRYFDIYRKHLTFDKTRALHLSQYLHDLGVFLHFQDDPLLKRTVILHNEWATEAVFKLVDDNTVKGSFGRFTAADCARIWEEPQYAEMIPELLTLMQKFELCYRLPDSKPETWLAPQLLPPSKPRQLESWETKDDLVLRFRYEFMPKGLISRLIVRQQRFVVRPNLCWVGGALFEYRDNQLLVILSSFSSEIVMRSRGPERKDLLAIVAADLDTLNSTFHNVKERVLKLIPCCCEKCRGSATPEYFDQKRLLQRKKDKKLKVECPASYIPVDVLALLDGVEATELSSIPRSGSVPLKSTSPTDAKKETRIFLASSADLIEDRDAIDLYLRQLNDLRLGYGQYLKIVRWEALNSAVFANRKQDEYNQSVAESDIVLCLFSTKAGAYTVEEFDVAYKSFEANGHPRIFTYFKEEKILARRELEQDLSSLWEFQDRLQRMGHFWSRYQSIEHLKRQLRDQLDLLPKD